jgi:hypothetical protein
LSTVISSVTKVVLHGGADVNNPPPLPKRVMVVEVAGEDAGVPPKSRKRQVRVARDAAAGVSRDEALGGAADGKMAEDGSFGGGGCGCEG